MFHISSLTDQIIQRKVIGRSTPLCSMAEAGYPPQIGRSRRLRRGPRRCARRCCGRQLMAGASPKNAAGTARSSARDGNRARKPQDQALR